MNRALFLVVFHLVQNFMVQPPLELVLILIGRRFQQTVIGVLVGDLLHLGHIQELPDRAFQRVVAPANEKHDLLRGLVVTILGFKPTNQMRFSRAALPVYSDELMLVLFVEDEFSIYLFFGILPALRRRDVELIHQTQTLDSNMGRQKITLGIRDRVRLHDRGKPLSRNRYIHVLPSYSRIVTFVTVVSTSCAFSGYKLQMSC